MVAAALTAFAAIGRFAAARSVRYWPAGEAAGEPASASVIPPTVAALEMTAALPAASAALAIQLSMAASSIP